MPVRNAEPWLGDCLESVIHQRFSDWELVAVDDGSTDDSGQILRHFAKAETRIQVYRNPGQGIIPALQKAYQQARGLLITRMDADDLMPPDKLYDLYQTWQNVGPGHLITGLVQYFPEDEIQDGYRRYADWLNRNNLSGNPFQQIYRECVIPSPCWLVHRNDLDRVGAFSPDTYPEDYDLVFRFYQAGLQPITVPKILHWWRDHPRRSSRTLEQYAANAYFDLKVSWFLRLDRQQNRTLVLWGAGRKGKALARLFQEAEHPFFWVCNQPKKWGHDIYGVVMHPPDWLFDLNNPQVVIGVSGPNDQNHIFRQLMAAGFQEGQDFYFFV